ncbi:MAG TPA: exopolysaccharide biosynthesis polyprenyl glycosylphosphotransferase [Acholeplasmataceae bacterium]|jgi:exopolysaccharide biosynthesis polyprenyl glycosylphosphotransferase|nr:exopolysaccharide biosynthesis polyprenyl glycosylphosphotransferase [Acholeplasmataceae bacterium]
MTRIAIIGADEAIKERVVPLLDDRKTRIIYLAWEKPDLSILASIDCLYMDDRLDRNYKEEIFHYCLKHNIKVWVFPSPIALAGKGCFTKKGNILACPLSDFRLSPGREALKRVFDFLFSLFAIIILFPLMAAIYIAIKLDDSGPAIYRQKRLTANHREFVLMKFRTMIDGAEEETGATLSPENDQRVTRVGKFLRRTRLDELPQIFNVLIGDMSVVGPRPERRCFVEQYERENAYYRYRFNVKAGITGLAQINCRYSANYADKLHFDLTYISRYRFWRDLMIIIRTIPVFFDGKAAEGIGRGFTAAVKNKGLTAIMIKPGVLELRDHDENNNPELQ